MAKKTNGKQRLMENTFDEIPEELNDKVEEYVSGCGSA